MRTIHIRRSLPAMGAAAMLAIAGVATAQVAFATQGDSHKQSVCHPVEGAGELGNGWNLIPPDKASSHINEETGAGFHTRKDGRTDVFAVDGKCPGEVIDEPTETVPPTETTTTPPVTETTEPPVTETTTPPVETTTPPVTETTEPPVTETTQPPTSTTTAPPTTAPPTTDGPTTAPPTEEPTTPPTVPSSPTTTTPPVVVTDPPPYPGIETWKEYNEYYYCKGSTAMVEVTTVTFANAFELVNNKWVEIAPDVTAYEVNNYPTGEDEQCQGDNPSPTPSKTSHPVKVVTHNSEVTPSSSTVTASSAAGAVPHALAMTGINLGAYYAVVAVLIVIGLSLIWYSRRAGRRH